MQRVVSFEDQPKWQYPISRLRLSPSPLCVLSHAAWFSSVRVGSLVGNTLLGNPRVHCMSVALHVLVLSIKLTVQET